MPTQRWRWPKRTPGYRVTWISTPWNAPFTVKVLYREGQRGFRLSVGSFREGAGSQSA